jgi:hypothetical protein
MINHTDKWGGFICLKIWALLIGTLIFLFTYGEEVKILRMTE